MKLIKVAAGVLNQTPLDWDQNRENIDRAIADARSADVSILCLPELCITGYGCEDAFHSPGVLTTALQALQEMVPQTAGMIVSFGLPVMVSGAIFNAACLAVDGKIIGLVCKQHLAGDGIHYEPRWFKKWPGGVTASIEIGEEEYPIGDLLFSCGGIRIGFEICEDAWVGDRPGADLAARGAEIILNPSASHFAFGKHEVRKRFILEGSRAFQVSYVYSNLLGNEAGRAIYDGDAMIASGGKILAMGPRLSFDDCVLTTAVINVETTRMMRARSGSFEPDVDNEPDDMIEAEFDFPGIAPEQPDDQQSDWEASEFHKEEEFSRAVALGLFDYLRKSRSRGVVISLSGGADSAAVTMLSALMLHFANDQIGVEGIRRKLEYIPNITELDSVKLLAKQLITTVYQSTRNSGDVTRNAAYDVAAEVNSRHFEFDVDSVVESYKSLVEGSLQRELTWETDDIALQNIQARVRSPSVWMLANIYGSLLLSTSNRSEAAVGYATMDGDTSGGLAPIAGIDKAFLRHWLRWMESEGPWQLGCFPRLKSVNDQQPTAELRPQSAEQTDEGDLMPYPILDEIERLAILDKLLPKQVLRMMISRHPDIGVKQLADWTERFFLLWCRNQWKRERYAPSFHLDDENLDPKTWCRFPILSGGFRRELREMRQFASEQWQ